MSIVVKTSWYEQFLNHLPNTKLYIRGQTGKDYSTQRQMEKDLIEQLKPLFEKWREETYREAYESGLQQKKEDEYEDGYQKGYDAGHEHGYDLGFRNGHKAYRDSGPY